MNGHTPKEEKIENKIKLFEHQKVRTAWNETEEKWYFSVVDVVGILTDSPNPRNYWKVLKHRMAKEGNQSVINCNQLKNAGEKELSEKIGQVSEN